MYFLIWQVLAFKVTNLIKFFLTIYKMTIAFFKTRYFTNVRGGGEYLQYFLHAWDIDVCDLSFGIIFQCIIKCLLIFLLQVRAAIFNINQPLFEEEENVTRSK